ncbi:SGNH/GDSL hydrolase family protein [Terriglobus roseus]|uniref:SGNH/GDSL hydrolase family protein n=1 Tax=Terriglobus roseus TaxID=392734 RepID=UPI0009F371BE|nr:SGNH/GDSL hydrolase family protein [Terriglobus roseus]
MLAQKVACGIAVLVLLTGPLAIRHVVQLPAGNAEYVAMGSSFAAGPGDGQRAPGSYFPCMRSSENYAHLLAKRTGMKLKDVTCSGATTRHILDGGQLFQPAQVDAVDTTTKLVTVTIGGNDVFYLGTLGAWACANDPAAVPAGARWVGLCMGMSNDRVQKAFVTLPAQMTRVVQEIHRRAPVARVLFIDYATVLPSQGTCGQLHLSSQEAETGRQIAARLAAVTAEVARATNSGLIKASEITQGHDVCSAQPWVYGFVFSEHILRFGPAPFHPRIEAMTAIAEALATEVAREPPYLERQTMRKETLPRQRTFHE